jgi:hypothetical protein
MALRSNRRLVAMPHKIKVLNNYMFVASAMLICIAACTPVMQLVTFNNTHGLIEVHFARKDIAIATGSSARFRYPQSNEKWTVRIFASGCELTYLLPHYLLGYKAPIQWFSAPVNVQIEPDLSIYLVPSDRGSVSNVSILASLQSDGFPLQPSSRTCHYGQETSVLSN